ncbi:MAG: transglycosylase domain-containing protein [Acidobacteriota bacterium]
MPLTRRTRIVLRWLVLLCLLAVAGGLLILGWGLALVGAGMERALAAAGSPRIFASPGVLRAGEAWTSEELQFFFAAHGLPPKPCSQPRPYEVCHTGNSFLLGPGLASGQTPVVVRASGSGLELSQANTGALREITLPPRLVALLPEKDTVQWPVALEQVSPGLINSVVDLEDRGFLSHPGLSLRGVLRATVANLTSGGVKQGGSTITQQVVKLLLLRPERRMSRKVLEAFLASLLEYRYSKRQILNAYLNHVYFGQDGGVSVVGVEAASRFYFGKPARFLSLHEAAILAGMIAAPNRFNPFQHPQAAKARRAQALSALQREGHVSGEEATEAQLGPLPTAPWPLRWEAAAHFLDLVEGKEVITTLDPVVQEAVRAGVGASLARLWAQRPALGEESGDPLQVAVVVVGADGRILALQGSKQPKPGELNRALSAKRPIGSLVKPFLVARALEEGWNLETTLFDEPLAVPVGTQLWTPQNHDGRFRGAISVKEALVHSVNVPMVRLGLSLGLSQVTNTLRELDLSPPGTPAELLGAVEASPLEVARAFTTFLAGGRLLEPWAVKPGRHHRQVFAPEAVRQVRRALEEVVESGTAAGFASRCGRPLAGKTGTTDNRRDSWFVALRPKFLVVVWVGTDRNRETGLYGASGAGVVWQEIDRRLPRVYKEGPWP